MNVKNVGRCLVILYPLGSTCNLRLLGNGTISKFFILMYLVILQDFFCLNSLHIPLPPFPKGLFEKQNYEDVVGMEMGGEG